MEKKLADLEASAAEEKRCRKTTEEQARDAVPKFKASDEYTADLKVYALKSYRAGFDLCQHQIEAMFPTMDTSYLHPSPTLKEAAWMRIDDAQAEASKGEGEEVEGLEQGELLPEPAEVLADPDLNAPINVNAAKVHEAVTILPNSKLPPTCGDGGEPVVLD